ncbi:MAG: TIR domain-containing protein [Opitutaceae bacterium]|nr:TIR domain-containing protein [Opitutaceae bacterium]
MSSAENKAVFLSYASQDADAARKIADALRAAGVEVWFDQSELRGGDSWDAKIRKQIKECALFVPVISANTNARREGYFRLEWRLADQRTHLMGKTGAFIVPVCIDDTRDHNADVPDSFLAVQWTRFPPCDIPPSFTEQVKLLLACGDPQVTPAPFVLPPKAPASLPPARSVSPTETTRPKRVPLALVMAGLAVAAAVITWQVRKIPDPPVPAAAQPAADLSTVGSAKVDAQSVAVLPFANISGDPAQEYFSDGLTEEILNALARERDLRVPGRTSSFSFKGKTIPATEIAKALNVSRLVEGSVRKVGNRVRISVTLTRASDGFTEELGSFDKEMTDGAAIFALQDEVARVVVEKLTQRRATLAVAVLTKNSAAYDAYLRGRALQTRAASLSRQAAEQYEQAVALDPGFALAWARLAEARFRYYSVGNNQSPALVESTRAAIEQAFAARPDLPEALIIRAHWARLVKSDFGAAERDLDRAAVLQPPTAELRFAQAALAQDRGDWTTAFVHLRESLALDPENGDQANPIANIFARRGNLSEADLLYARAIRIAGTENGSPFANRVWHRQRWRGPEAALRLIERAPAGQSALDHLRAATLFYVGRVDEARAIARRLATDGSTDISSVVDAENWASVLTTLGLNELARARWENVSHLARKEFEGNNRAPRVRRAFVRAEIALGRRDAAAAELAAWRSDLEKLPSAYRRYADFWRLAVDCYAELGKVDEIVALLREIRSHGYVLDGAVRDISGAVPLRNDPRFQKLVEEDESWAKAQPDPVDL